MALTTYDELRTSLASWLNRADLDSVIPDFIALAEAQLNRDVRHWRAISYDQSYTIDARFIDKPSDWLETISLTADPAKPPLKLVSMSDMQTMRGANADATGEPKYYTHGNSQIEVYPSPGDTYTGELVYFAELPSLADNNVNWLLTYAPDAYLYGSLVASAPFLHHDERLPTWAQLYAAAVQRLNAESDAAKWSGTGLRMRGRM